MLTSNRRGGYTYLPGSRFAAHGVVADDGHAIHQAVFAEPVPWDAGFVAIRSELERLGRPIESLCGIELRMPQAIPFSAFIEVNDRYMAQLDEWKLLVDGQSPFCRTNVCPWTNSLVGPSVAAFSYTAPGSAKLPTFVLSGAAEVPLGAPFPSGVVRLGDTSPEGVAAKTEAIVEIVHSHLVDLGVAWDDSVDVHLYAAHEAAYALSRQYLARIGVVPDQGIVWHDATPPTHNIDVEIDLRRYAARRLIAD